MSRTQTSYTGYEFLWLVMMTSFSSRESGPNTNKNGADYGAIRRRVKRFFTRFYGPYSAPPRVDLLDVVAADGV